MSTTASLTPAQDCMHRAIYAFGTAEIFRKRSDRYRARLNRLTFFGLAGLVVIGAVVIAFGPGSAYVGLLLGVVGLVAVAQSLYSLWALTDRWADHLEYSTVSATDNYQLATKFAELAAECASPKPAFQERLASLRASDDSRRASDSARNIVEKEMRYGHRAGLRHYQVPCATCKKVPESMRASECDVCGSF